MMPFMQAVLLTLAIAQVILQRWIPFLQHASYLLQLLLLFLQDDPLLATATYFLQFFMLSFCDNAWKHFWHSL